MVKQFAIQKKKEDMVFKADDSFLQKELRQVSNHILKNNLIKHCGLIKSIKNS